MDTGFNQLICIKCCFYIWDIVYWWYYRGYTTKRFKLTVTNKMLIFCVHIANRISGLLVKLINNVIYYDWIQYNQICNDRHVRLRSTFSIR